MAFQPPGPQRSAERDLPEQAAARLRAEQLATIMRHFTGAALANICNPLIFVIASWRTSHWLLALSWSLIIWAIVGFMIVRQWRRRFKVRPVARVRRRHRIPLLIVYALALGAAWAALPLLFFDGATHGAKLLIACLSSGMLGGGVFVFASVPEAALAFSGPIAIGSAIALLRVGDADHVLMAIVLAGYSAILFLGSFSYASELRDLVATQFRAEEHASAAAQSLGVVAETAAGLAHEISQPLAAATAYIKSAERLVRMPAEKRPIPIEQALQGAAGQMESMREVIANMRESIANPTRKRTYVRVHEIVRQVIAANRGRQEEEHVRIEEGLSAENDRVFANAVELRQVFTNLISNAFDAMQNGSTRVLSISSHAAGERTIQIDVADTGCGISPAVKGKLFEPLITTKAQGLGVGLSITRSIVANHRGQIGFQPNPGGGTIFSVILPLKPESESEPKSADDADPESTR